MRPPLAPLRTRRELAATPCHVVVRDYPETLATFRSHGLDPARVGGEPVEDLLDGDPAPLLDELEARIAWRSRSQ